ncbi:hypothetical protein AK812_SmicGene34624 [Symbiodinium microadriaticum]|uniref:Uncharacterized protein n=1 Tax=Symbiodinium microadriaticum TaxID=2951 RepID=A0A1Q9CNJ3_SYMMI|nr:hypothetical protein AK812_SmicGene34624 [Symbiodinium microadriaticum]
MKCTALTLVREDLWLSAGFTGVQCTRLLETRSACTAGPFNLSIFLGAAWKSLPCAEERRWPSSISCSAGPMMEVRLMFKQHVS